MLEQPAIPAGGHGANRIARGPPNAAALDRFQ
jgi:hypothetical protein